MMKKKYITILVSLVLLIILSNVNVVKSEPTAQTSTPQAAAYTAIETIATKDTYVDSHEPLANFGGQEYLWCGFYNYTYSVDSIEIAYFYFPFTDKPDSFDLALIGLSIWGVSQTLEVKVNVVDEEWNEMGMTWTNQPTMTGIYWNFNITGSTDWIILNATSFIEGRDSLSICVYTSNHIQEDFFGIDSRESYYSDYTDDRPRLAWLTEIPDVPPSSGGGGGGGGGGDDDKTTDDFVNTALIGIIGGSIVVGGIAIIITWKKGLFTKGRKEITHEVQTREKNVPNKENTKDDR